MSTALVGLPAGWSGTRVPSTGSTNADLLAAARAGAAHGTVLAADEQTAGRGRLGRHWVTPAGSALAVSVLLRPAVDRACWTWLPLLAGLAVGDALADVAPTLAVVLKWPNDVLVAGDGGGGDDEAGEGGEAGRARGIGGDGGHREGGGAGEGDGGRKLAGILVEQAGDGTARHPGAVVVGIGLNVAVPARAFPADAHATSLAAALGGGPMTVPAGELVLAAVVRALAARYSSWSAAAGPADPAGGLAADYRTRCATLGRRVRVERAGAPDLEGVATGVAADGALVVDRRDGTPPVTVHAGDVRHLRAVAASPVTPAVPVAPAVLATSPVPVAPAVLATPAVPVAPVD